MSLLTNPVFASVIIMCILCLLKVNVMLAIIISAILGGFIAGMPLDQIIEVFIGNMGEQSETALSYVLLGVLAVGIYESGLAVMISNQIEKAVGKNAKLFLLLLAFVACLSQNLIPIHIAFVPILVPPLLHMMNEMQLDRRAAACALCFGLKAPYVALPFGFGAIFHGIIADNMRLNGMEIASNTLWRYLIIPGASMTLGLLFAIFISFRKKRVYKDLPIKIGEGDQKKFVTDRITRKHVGAALGALSTFAVQIMTESMPLGAMVGVIVMIAFGTISFKDMDETVEGGVKLMGFMAFVMLTAGGYAGIVRASGGVDEIVQMAANAVGGNMVLGAVVMLLVGLLIDMGIGTSFGTVPIVAPIYVPLCMTLGFSAPATAVLIGVAGALGDAGSPASDSTLGPTAGLNMDGQHDHIWDTCVPTFLHYNIPLFISGVLVAVALS